MAVEGKDTGRVTGVGGVFLKAKDPDALYAWYEKHLGILREDYGSFAFPKSAVNSSTVLAFFPEDSNNFGGSGQRAMLNLRVADLDFLLDSLVAAGVTVEPKRDVYDDFGKFAWISDPEGNRVELWEPLGAALE